LSVFSIALSLWLVGLFFLGAWNGWQMLQSLKNRLEMQVFLLDSVGLEQAHQLRKNLLTIPGVDSVVFVSKYDAMQQFQKEFGENILDVLGDNPLPASFRIKLKPAYHSRQKVKAIIEQIEKYPEVEDVTYRYDLLTLIEKYVKVFFGIGMFLGTLVGVVSLVLISNTVRMAILNRKEEIQIMRLVGATPGFIRGPFLVQGVYLGILGALFALFFQQITLWMARYALGVTVQNAREIFALLTFWGIILGFWGSWRATSKYLHEKY
jgi:cell division transport system permease protein